LTTREASALLHAIKTNWHDNVEVKNVWQFLGCSVFGEAAMYSKSPHAATRNATIVALEDSMAVSMSKADYLVSVCFICCDDEFYMLTHFA
jgi:hypothetical protein